MNDYIRVQLRLKGQMHITYFDVQENQDPVLTKKMPKYLAHSEFKALMQRFSIHLAYSNDELTHSDAKSLLGDGTTSSNEKAKAKIDSFNAKFSTKEVLLKGEGDFIVVFITGSKNVKTKRVVDRKSPPLRLSEGDEEIYEFVTELENDLNALFAECDRYLIERKSEGSNQMSMFENNAKEKEGENS